MTKTRYVEVGTRVERKRDGAHGTIVNRYALKYRGPIPGTKTLLDIRLDDAVLASQAGGDMTGELSWFVSNFRVVEGK